MDKRQSSTRRSFLSNASGAALAASGGAVASAQEVEAEAENVLKINPEPGHKISPYLYMQFMEPLGTTDSSVEASWDHLKDDWRDDLMTVSKELAPTMMRWGGIYTDFYRWREGVGPRDQRVPMHNLMWGGIESNQIGTYEFVDFCRRVGADPLMCVNFESDGRERFMEAKGSVRTAGKEEAADWVSYCNDPDNAERRGHGHTDPLTIKYWQLGNETSYDRKGFDLETTGRKTVEFAKAMRERDPSIELIAWGDSGWAPKMRDMVGEHVEMLAFHQMFNPDDPKNPVLEGELYRRDPDATWAQLMKAWAINDRKIRQVRRSLGKHPMPLALTECHFSIPGRDRCDVNSTWAAGVSYGRILNNHQRHSDLIQIATAADFSGNRWQVNAVMIPTPRKRGDAYLMPVARVMALYRHHIGDRFLEVTKVPEGLDVVASRTGRKLFFHVVNVRAKRSVSARFLGPDLKIKKATAFEIADDPMVEISDLNSNEVMQIREHQLPVGEVWNFPPASVTAVEVELA
ncbi:MAG: alpha-L-arabinofuranosidase [Verrucomicrobiota bacterium]